MSPNLAWYTRIFLVLSVIALVGGLMISLRATFVLVDPSRDQKVLTPPFDIVVEHKGCGTVDTATFEAYLVNEKRERIDVDFKLDKSYTAGQRWVLADYDPWANLDEEERKNRIKERFFLHVSADESGLCFVYLPVFSFEVAAYIAPTIFGQVPGTGPAIFSPPYSGTVIFHSMLHDGEDTDKFTVNATDTVPNGAFGSWFNITVSSVEPCDCKDPCDCENPSDCKAPCNCEAPCGCKDPSVCYTFAFSLLSPKDDGLITTKKTSSTLWIGLKKGVSTKFSVTSADRFPIGSLVPYKVTITQTSIPDLNEPNDTPDTATYLKKGTSIEGYMVNVLDKNGEWVGLHDWFQIDHRDCVDDCFVVTLPAGGTRSYCIDPGCGQTNSNSSNNAVKSDLKGCTKPDRANFKTCSADNDNRIEVCAFFNWRCPLGGEYGDKDGKRYWDVYPYQTLNLSDPFGDASDTGPGKANSKRYGEKYKVEWFEKCQYTHDDGHPRSCVVPGIDINALKP